MKTKNTLVNVPRNREDAFYRYKMELIRVKVEGKGKMVKTSLENIDDIAQSLERPTDYIMKFFAFELSVQYSFKNNKHTLGSARSASELQKLLDIFIDKFIVCGSCGNPETVLRISKNQLVLSCKACGYKTIIQYLHRVTDYIEKKIIVENKEKKKIKKVIPKNQNPIDSLKTFWKLDPKDTEIITQIQEFQEDNKLDNEQLITYIFQSLFGDFKNIFSLLEQKCKIYRLFKDKEQFQQITLFSIEKIM